MTEGLGQHATTCAALAEVGRYFDARGWVPATGGNFSVRLLDNRALLTASGTHKGHLEAGDFVIVDVAGHSVSGGKPSYETGLHQAVYRRLPAVGAVLHEHSPAATVLSRHRDKIVLCGYELQKALPGAPDPQRACEVPVFDNDQDIARLAGRLEQRLRAEPLLAGCLIRGHGLYAWGRDVAEARHRVEALEFMFECELLEERIGA
ncbi:MAG TPA: methylthioribulose 1-phosphate dehydratase [Nevskiaceae bacterium]|nr:methylthioribulose 1-phosphate dehydratase [Nevskiaceae bacterium]